MKSVGWKFRVCSVLSAIVGLREFYIAWIALANPELVAVHLTAEGFALASLEFLWLIAGGLFLVGWPIVFHSRI